MTSLLGSWYAATPSHTLDQQGVAACTSRSWIDQTQRTNKSSKPVGPVITTAAAGARCVNSTSLVVLGCLCILSVLVGVSLYLVCLCRQVCLWSGSFPVVVVGQHAIQHWLSILKQLCHGLEQRNAHNAEKSHLHDDMTCCHCAAGRCQSPPGLPPLLGN